MQRRFLNDRGFTLIELLVVISIISIMIAILLPALRTARTAAKRTQSLSQARQLSMGLRMYAQSYKDYLPYHRARSAVQEANGTAGNPNGAYWQGVLYHEGFMSSFDVYWSPGHDRCPAIAYLPAFKTTKEHWEWRMTDYAINYDGGMPDQNVPNTKTFRLGSMSPPPASHLMLYEAVRGKDWDFIPPATTPFTYSGAVVRTYMDGHGVAADGADMNWQGVDGFAGQWFWPTGFPFRAKPWYRLGMEYDW